MLALLPLAALLVPAIQITMGQTSGLYPEWVDNDYNCGEWGLYLDESADSLKSSAACNRSRQQNLPRRLSLLPHQVPSN